MCYILLFLIFDCWISLSYPGIKFFIWIQIIIMMIILIARQKKNKKTKSSLLIVLDWQMINVIRTSYIVYVGDDYVWLAACIFSFLKKRQSEIFFFFCKNLILKTLLSYYHHCILLFFFITFTATEYKKTDTFIFIKKI